MRYIHKQPEPEFLTTWKQQKKNRKKEWRNFNLRKKVRTLLINEQGHICCYCQVRISENNCSIEHLIPRSFEKPRKSADQSIWYDYGNFLASCTGKDENEERPACCDQKRGDRLLPISPLDKTCADAFRYTDGGQILPEENSPRKGEAKAMIEILCLDIDRLRRQRRLAISKYFQDIETFTPEEIQRFAESFDRPDAEGKYEEFCNAIVYALKQLVKPSTGN